MQPEEVRQPAPQQLLRAGSDVTTAAIQEGVRFFEGSRVTARHADLTFKSDQYVSIIATKNYEHVALMTESRKLLHLIWKCHPSKQINNGKKVHNDTRIKFDTFK